MYARRERLSADALMSFAALCMMAESRGWVVVIAANHGGADLKAQDDAARMRTLALYESKQQWRTVGAVPIVSVRLDDPPQTLDRAATAIGLALQVSGVD